MGNERSPQALALLVWLRECERLSLSPRVHERVRVMEEARRIRLQECDGKPCAGVGVPLEALSPGLQAFFVSGWLFKEWE